MQPILLGLSFRTDMKNVASSTQLNKAQLMQSITVIKRSGARVPLNIEKWQDQIAKVCAGIADVSQSMIEIKAQPQFYNGMTTKEIDEITLRAIVDLINVDHNPDVGNTNYQFVAGKQRLSMLRKDIYGSYEVPSLYSIVCKNVEAGRYTEELLSWYTPEEWARIEGFVDHSKDEEYSYASIEQLIEKYLVKNKTTGQVYETPQIRYIVASATVFHAEAKNVRMKYIKDYYNAASDGLFTLSTPVLAGLGTPTKQFSSCVLIKTDDSLDSIFSSGEMMAKYAAKRAGIGLEMGRIRPAGSPIRGGEISHTGQIPFLKKAFGDLRSCCVTPDTWVEIGELANSSRIQIKDVLVGMQIKTMTPDGIVVFREITDKFETPVPREDQVKLTFSNGAVINCSSNHPIVVIREQVQERVDPLDLLFKDVIVTDDGYTNLAERAVGQNNDPTYLDITVDDTHLFFASDSATGPMILTKNSQGGIRNSSCTVTYPIWHYEFENLVVLKNNQGTDETRVRHMDYSFVLSKLFWKRFLNQENITFFDPNQVPDLYEAFYRDIKLFDELYVKYESDANVTKKVMSADEVFRGGLLKERTDTGRIYLMFTDNAQNQGPFDPLIDPIYQSNLCQEILLPTVSFNSLDDEGEFEIEIDDGCSLTLPGQHFVLLSNGHMKKVRELTEADDISNLLV